MDPGALDHAMLARAARAALRGQGHVEPNPMVGCVIARPDGTLLGIGHHRRFGAEHAEVDALNNCRARSHDPRGATAWVTLEPCSHFGKQPPCCDALIRAGLARVVAARLDPNPISSGGAARLTAAGINFEIVSAEPAVRVGDPFAKRIITGLPWVIAKWAQTIDGRIADRHTESKWISCPASRRRVHALRGRVDAILTAIGTVRADDPLLTPRGVKRRRLPRRVVIDPRLEISDSSRLLATRSEAPLTIITSPLPEAARARAARLAAIGVDLIEMPITPRGIALTPVLRSLAQRHHISTVLVEAGPGLLGRMFEEDLIDEARVFIAPMLLGDPAAPSAAHIAAGQTLAGSKRFGLTRLARSGTDVYATWMRSTR